MDLSWPGEIKKTESVLSAFYLNLPEVVQPQCLLSTRAIIFSNNDGIILIWIVVYGIFILLMFIPSCIKYCTRCCCKESRDEFVDKVYNKLGLMMSLLAMTFTKVAMSFYFFLIKTIFCCNGRAAFIGNIVYYVSIFPFIFYIFFKYFREMRVMQGKWNGELSYCCLKPITMSQERLKRRLHYLTKRFSNHAPYWQFIIWGRQISILIVNFNIKNKWTMAGIVIIICSLALQLHVRVKPFIHDFQNEVDKWLLICNIIIVFIGVIYSELLKPNIENDTSNVWSWIVTLIILIAMFGSVLGAIIYLRLWKKFYILLRQMWKHDGVVTSNRNNDEMDKRKEDEYTLLEDNENNGEAFDSDVNTNGKEDLIKQQRKIAEENFRQLELYRKKDPSFTFADLYKKQKADEKAKVIEQKRKVALERREAKRKAEISRQHLKIALERQAESSKDSSR